MCQATNPLDLITGRRSIRAFTRQPVTPGTIRSLLEAAMAAPSACGKDPWRFVVVEDQATRERITEKLPNGAMLKNAPTGIVVCGDPSAAHDGQPGYMLQDCSAAIENLLLAANGLGLGACWLGVYPREERMAHIREVLLIPAAITPIACVALGRPAEEKRGRSRYRDEYIYREKWGGRFEAIQERVDGKSGW